MEWARQDFYALSLHMAAILFVAALVLAALYWVGVTQPERTLAGAAFLTIMVSMAVYAVLLVDTWLLNRFELQGWLFVLFGSALLVALAKGVKR